MPRSPLLPVLLACALSACASSEIICPDPVGAITLDDCELYAERYAAMRARLGGTEAPGSGPNLGTLGVQDPGQLIQREVQRILTLCRDFNACRLAPLVYRKRREALDRTATAMLSIGQQLRQPGLSTHERQRLNERLIQLTTAPSSLAPDDDDDDGHGTDRRPAPAAASASPASDATPAKAAAERKTVTAPWFGARIAPPVAPPVERDLPRLVWPWAEPGLTNVMEQVNREFQDQTGRTWQRRNEVVGYRPRLLIVLWGRAAADDVVELRFENGAKSRCPVGQRASGVFSVVCDPPPELALTGPRFEVEIRYCQAISDVPVRLGTVQYDVTRADERQEAGPPIHTYYLDWDQRRSEGWAYFAPEPSPAAPAYEQLHLHTTVRLGRIKPQARVRCLVDGEAAADLVEPGPESGSTGWMQHQPAKIKLGDGSVQDNPNAYLHWWHFDFPLPFALSPRGGVLPAGLQAWPYQHGLWECTVSLDGVPVRELVFTVHKDGQIETLDEQVGLEGQLIHPWFAVQTAIIPNTAEIERTPTE